MCVGGEEGDASGWETGVVGGFAGCGGGFLGGAGAGFAGYCAGSGAGLRTRLRAGCCGLFVVVGVRTGFLGRVGGLCCCCSG